MATSSFKYILLIAALVQISSGHKHDKDRVIEGTELLMTFLTHRHGDRTPVEDIMIIALNKEELVELIEPWGYGQLTNVGRRRGYELGKFIRRRYDDLLSDTFNKSEIYIRSTDSTRAKMTVLTAMAAVYPAVGDTWSKRINWVPIPYTTVPARDDFNLALMNCPAFKSINTQLQYTNSPSMASFSSVIEDISEIIQYDITNYPNYAYTIYDLFVSEISLGIDLGEEVNALLPDIEAAAGVAIDNLFGDNDYIALGGGVLLNEFFTYANAVIAGNDTQRVRIYSAHDFIVYAISAVAQITPRQGVPAYGSAFALELRRVVKTGQIVVLVPEFEGLVTIFSHTARASPVYLPSPGEKEVYLNVDGCKGLLCDFDSFYSITSKYLLDFDSWRSKCGYTDDFEIDSSNID